MGTTLNEQDWLPDRSIFEKEVDRGARDIIFVNKAAGFCYSMSVLKSRDLEV